MIPTLKRRKLRYIRPDSTADGFKGFHSPFILQRPLVIRISPFPVRNTVAKYVRKIGEALAARGLQHGIPSRSKSAAQNLGCAPSVHWLWALRGEACVAHPIPRYPLMSLPDCRCYSNAAQSTVAFAKA